MSFTAPMTAPVAATISMCPARVSGGLGRGPLGMRRPQAGRLSNAPSHVSTAIPAIAP